MSVSLASQDPRVQAIRNDLYVGEGSCSCVDECYGDEELLEMLDERGIDLAGAVAWARDCEGAHLEQGLNQRWGEDSDPQLAAYRKFQEISNS